MSGHGDVWDAFRHRYSPEGVAELDELVESGRALVDLADAWSGRAWAFFRLGHEAPEGVDVAGDARVGDDLFAVAGRLMGIAEALVNGAPSTACPSWWPESPEGRIERLRAV